MAVGPGAMGEHARQKLASEIAKFENMIDEFIKGQDEEHFEVEVDFKETFPDLGRDFWAVHLMPKYKEAGWVFSPNWAYKWPTVKFTVKPNER